VNIGSSKIGKISPVFFPGINLRYADGNGLENILVVVTITPGQLHNNKFKSAKEIAESYKVCQYF
jgi:hypothetical protein